MPYDDEARFARLMQEMLSRADYALPLAAAESQFRRHYYRLTAAALLEDLFFDALGNYMRRFSPAVAFERAPSGVPGWDYRVGSLEISHKVALGAGGVAVHWDATLSAATWSSDRPIVLAIPSYVPITTFLELRPLGLHPAVGAVPFTKGRSIRAGNAWLVVRWSEPPAIGRALSVSISAKPGDLSSQTTFGELWARVAESADEGAGANEVEVLAVRSGRAGQIAKAWFDAGGRELELRSAIRSGYYVIPSAWLQNVAVVGNNRSARILPKEIVRDLARRSRAKGLFAPLPLWYQAFAGDAPPDLYHAQRGEFDRQFSARRIAPLDQLGEAT
jgi:hypothetical protein